MILKNADLPGMRERGNNKILENFIPKLGEPAFITNQIFVDLFHSFNRILQSSECGLP